MKNILASLADWANGLFALLLASYVTDTELLWWYIPIALLLSHLPDIDAIPELIQRGKVSASAEHSRDHRTFLHFPIISIPLSFISVLLFGFWGWLVFFGIVLHLLNDLYGTGWGIPLRWPFSKRRYKIFGRRANRLKSLLITEGHWDHLTKNERRLRIFVSWDVNELPEYIQKWGVDDWIEKWYLRLNWISGIEYCLFILACVLVFLQLL